MFSFVKYLISFCINLTNSLFVTYVNTFRTNVYFPDLFGFRHEDQADFTFRAYTVMKPFCTQNLI